MASNDRNFVVKNSITIGQGTGNSYTLQTTDGVTGQLLITDGNGNVTWQHFNIENLFNVSVVNPTDGQVLSYVSASDIWVNTDANFSGGANVIIASDAPDSPNAGDLWWDSTSGDLYIWYDDGDSQQWVISTAPRPGPTGPQGPIGVVVYDGGRPDTDFSVGVNINCGGVT
jgi:hypothetical protein